MKLTKRVNLGLYNQLREVDDTYVDHYLSIFKKDSSVQTGHFYIRKFNVDDVNIKSQHFFWKDCLKFLSWQEHLESVASGDVDREYIQREEKRLSVELIVSK